MSKQSKSVFGIFAESVGLYFSQLDKFLKYMTFPVLGQILGLGLVFLITYFYSQNLPKLIDKYPNINDFWILIGISTVIILPGLAIFCKAFWEYLVAYGAVNSMFFNLQKSKKVYDFEAHNELIKRNSLKFIGLWMLFGIFSVIAACPLMWIICGIFAVYFVLAFQVFTFEPEQSPWGCLKKSLLLIKGHFAQTFSLMIMAATLTYFLIPQIILKGFDYTGISNLIAGLIMPIVNIIPELNLEAYNLGSVTHTDYASMIVRSTVVQILIQYTLPLRSILWSNWYKELNGNITQQELPKTKSGTKKKRPSTKLMEESNKKFSKKKIDDNILKRAMEKDDE
jgi:hypothetical protein